MAAWWSRSWPPRRAASSANRDFVAASVDVHHAIEIGAQVGIGFRGSRISIFDAAGVALPRG